MNDIKIVDAEKAELKVSYCIPDWLRNEQIKLSVQRFKKRLQPVSKLRNEPVALVCFGPSLNKTWEKIKGFKYVISCSGSHKFLKDREITPTWHVEVDPRSHKIQLIGDNISSNTEFLMASCCHPEVFDHLEKHKASITLWHTYSGEKKSKLPLVYPRGEWVSTGGANVGLRALVLARLLGFTDIHLFGMDGSFPVDGELKHAAFHPNVAKKHIIAEYDGKQYATTTAFLVCGRQFLHEVRMLPDVEVTLYGEGLVQDMAKKKLREVKRKDKSNIAFYVAPTISAEYASQNRLLHSRNATYGISVLKHLETVKKLYRVTEATSLLDYGCGKGLLAKNFDFPIWEYDPAIEEKDAPPRPADLVVCIDVLEHVEPQYLDATLRDIARCVLKVGYFVISTQAAMKVLPNGQNTHRILKGRDWWAGCVAEYFHIPKKGVSEKEGDIHIVVSPKSGSKPKCEAVTLKKEEKCPSLVASKA